MHHCPIVAAALRTAAEYDARLPFADGIEHSCLTEVGELIGGLSAEGFAADLRAWLEDRDEGVMVGWNLSRIPEDKAEWWLCRAGELMFRVELEDAA